MYLLVGVPVLTELIETGRLPESPRQWVTEVVAGAVIAALVHKVRKEHLVVLGPLGISAGVVELDSQEAASEFIRRADDAMYRERQSRQPHATRS